MNLDELDEFRWPSINHTEHRYIALNIGRREQNFQTKKKGKNRET